MLLPLALAAAALATPLVVSVPGGVVDGSPILGRTVPQVERALGTPTSEERFPRRRDLAYGSRLEVIFHGPDGDPAAQTAWAILVTDRSASVAGRAALLASTPRTLERQLRTTGLHEERPYRCDARGCFGTFFGRGLHAGGTRRVIYGVQHGAPYIGVQIWPNPR